MMVNGSDADVGSPVMIIERLKDLTELINVIYLPLLVLFGVFGNIVSIIVIFGSKLRFIPPNPYLAYLCVSDTAFLISIIPVWFHLMSTNVNDGGFISPFMCRLHLYVMNCASWLSSWIITALTLERFAVVTTERGRLRSRSSAERARWITAAILPLPLVFNSYVFFWVDVRPPYGDCDILPDYEVYGLVVNVADTIIVFLLPLVINLIANGSVFVRLWTERLPVTRLIVRDAQSSLRRHISSDHITRQRHQLAKILIVVPMVFLALNLPSYGLRIYSFICLIMDDESMQLTSTLWVTVSEVALLMNYTNFGINFVVYCMASRSFRATPSKLIRGRARRLGANLRSNQNSFSRRAPSAKPSTGGEPTADAEPMRSATRPRNHLSPDDYELLTTASSCTRTNSPRNSNTQSDFTGISTAITNL